MFIKVNTDPEIPILTIDNVAEQLKNAGFVINFYGGASIKDLDPGQFGDETHLIKSGMTLHPAELPNSLKDSSFKSAGIINFAEALIKNPNLISYRSVCIQNTHPDKDGNFVYAIASSWFGENRIGISKGGRVWLEGNYFLGVKITD
jgi:hypothetical protein